MVSVLFGDFGQVFTYQGKLTDATGIPAEDPVNMTFTIYTAPVGGVSVWSKSVPGVDPEHGIFSVMLDISTGDPTSVNWDAHPELWLQVTVATVVLSPRERLTSAFHALNVANNAVAEAKLRMTSHGTAGEDGYLLSFDHASGGFTWIDPSDVGGVNSIIGGDNIQVSSGTGNVTIDVAPQGAGSALDADLLDGEHGSYYLNADNINAGTLHTDRFSAYDDLVAESKIGADADQVAAGDHSHTNMVTGTGTATRVAFWDGPNSLSSSANLYWNGTNSRLGIGTTGPAGVLDINQPGSGTPVRIQGGSLNHLGLVFDNAGPGARKYRLSTTRDDTPLMDGGMFVLMDVTGVDVPGAHTGSDGLVRLVVNASGNVGVGTVSPTSKLDVTGTGRFTDQVTIPETPTADAHAASKKYVDDQIATAGDGWGSQVVETDATLTGNGTAGNELSVVYGSTANTAVQGNQTATITAGTGLTGGISGDALGDGFSATLNVDFAGTGVANIAARSDHDHDSDYDNYNYWTASDGSNTSNIGSATTLTYAGSGGVTTSLAGNTLTIDASSAGDNLGNHTATQNIQTNGYWLSNDGDNEGVFVSTAGNVGIGTNGPSEKLEVDGGLRVRTINNAPGDILTVSGTGVVQKRTPEEIRTDIGAAQDVNSVYYVEGNTSGSSGTWTGSITGLTAYYDGLKIAYKIGVAGISTGTTLNLNGLGAIACRRNNGNLTTHLPVGTVVYLTYTTISGTGYWVWADYDSIETYTVRWNNNLQAGAEITRYKIVMAGTDGRWYPLTIGNTTAATKTVASTEFRIESPIVSYYYNGTVAAGATSSSYWYEGYTMANLDYTLNQSTGFSAYMPLYLKGTINSNGNFVLDGAGGVNNDFWTQTLPSTEDGKVYIMIGIMHNTTTSMRLMVNKPIYEFKDGNLRIYTPEHVHDSDNEAPSNTYDIRGSIALGAPSSDTWQRGTEIQPKVDILVYQAFVCWGNEKFRIWRNSDAALMREVDLTGVVAGSWQTVDIFPPILLKAGENYTITCKNNPAGNNYAELSPSGPPDETYVTYVQGRTINGTGFPDPTPGFHPVVDIKFLPGGGGSANMDPYSIKGNPVGTVEPAVDIFLDENQVLGRKVGDIVGINIGMGDGEIAPGNHTHTGALTSTLQHGRIYIGDIDNSASEQTVYGDAVLAPDGLITITTGAVDGTNIALGGDAKGDIMYYDGTQWALLSGSTTHDYVLAYNTAIDEPYWRLDDTGGSIDGSGTPNKISKFVGTGTTIADSRVEDDGVNPVEVDADLTTTGNLTVEGNTITFGNLESIDNSIDGIVRITGDSRVTGHLGVNNMDPHGNYSINVDNTAVGGRAINIITQADNSSGAYSTAGGKFSNRAYSAVAEQAFDGSSTNSKYGYHATLSAYADNAGQTVNNYGAYLIASGSTGAGGITNNYGLWASASGGNTNIAGYFDGGIRLIGHFYDQGGSEGTPGQILSTTASGTEWIDASSGLVNDGSNGAVAYYSGTTTLSASAVGVTGQALISGNSGAPTWWAPNQGSVVFAGVGGILAEQRSAQEQFYWDNTNFRLGLGTEFPQARLDINKNGTGIQEAMMIRNSNAAVINQGASAVFAAYRTGGTLTKVASVGGVITDITAGAYKGALVFNTSDNAAPAERMRITHQGNVGIGVSDPGSYKLYVDGNAFVKTPITGTGTSTDGPAVSTDFLNGQTSMTGAGGLKIYTYLGNGGAASGGGGGSGSVSNGLAYAVAYYPAGGTTVDDLPHGQPGQILRSGGSVAAPSWSTPTYPNTATAGKILMGDGTNIVLSTPGFPLAAGPAGTILRSDGTNWAASTATYPNTVAQGDILYGSAANTIIALAKNTTATRYLSNTGASNSPAWAQVNLANGVTGTLPVANGGTGRTTLTSNGVLYGLGASAVGMTAAGGDGQVLSTSSGTPTWTSGGSSGQVLMKSASGLPTWSSISTGSGTVDPGNQYRLAYYPNASGGTVVDDLPAGLGSSNQVLHGNASGAPTWGQVTSADIQDLTIVNADIANNTIVASSKINASGTPGATTFLRGDNTWAVPGAGSVTGSGTANYVPKWNGASSLTNSQIIDNGTNVGIGTSPSAKLDVNGTMRIRGGSPAANKVLSSTNVSGDAVWVPLTVSSSFVHVYNSNADRCVNSTSWLSFSGCSGTIYLEAGQKVLAWAQGGVMADNDCNGTSDNSYSNYDVRIAINGNDFQNGAWIRSSVDNTSNVWKTNHMPFNGWSVAGQQTISSSGNYTFTLQARKNSGDNCIMGGDNSSSLQATMILLILNP
jgi:hypothetical protein